MDQQTADALENYLDEHGWYQGASMGPNGSHCILAAAWEVTGTGYIGSAHMDPARALNDAASLLFPERADQRGVGFGKLPAAAVNDHPRTTREDISLIIKHAIDQG